MIRALVTIASVLLFSGIAEAQCPEFSMNSVHTSGGVGSSFVYLARPRSSIAGMTPIFNWKVEGGDIVDGQGTNALEVRRNTYRLHVTLTVSGLGGGCDQTMSETGHIDPAPTATKIAEFTGPLASRPHEEYEAIARALKSDPSAALYVIISGTGKDPLDSITAKRALLIRRLRNVVGSLYPIRLVEHLSSRDDRVTIWLVPAGASSPYW